MNLKCNGKEAHDFFIKGSFRFGFTKPFNEEVMLRVYSKVSIIRHDCSRLLEFEKKDSTGCLIETFSKYPDQVV